MSASMRAGRPDWRREALARGARQIASRPAADAAANRSLRSSASRLISPLTVWKRMDVAIRLSAKPLSTTESPMSKTADPRREG